MKTRKQKVQVWIFSPSQGGSEPRFLILRTLPARGGFWQPVTGGVEPGEELAAAALREAQEETGLSFQTVPVPLGQPFEYERKEVLFEEHGFSVSLGQKEGGSLPAIRLDGREHDAWEWVSYRDARARLKFDSNRQMIDSLWHLLNLC